MKKYLVGLGIAVIVIVTLWVSFVTWMNGSISMYLTDGKMEISVADFNCGPFTLSLSEEIRINRLEGSNSRYDLTYEKGVETIPLQISYQSYFEGDGIYTNIVDLENTSFEKNFFEPVTQLKRPKHIVVINPLKFSHEQYVSISSCLKQNNDAIYQDYVTQNKKDQGLNVASKEILWFNNSVPDLLGTVYTDMISLLKAVEGQKTKRRAQSLSDIVTRIEALVFS